MLEVGLIWADTHAVKRIGEITLVSATALLVWGTGFEARSFGPIRFLLRTMPYGDKVGHFVVYGVIVFALTIVLRSQIRSACGALSMFIVGIADEYRQLFDIDRNFELNDVLANTAGILCGLIAASHALRRLEHNDERSGETSSLGENDELQEARTKDDAEQYGDEYDRSLAH